ncbi:amidase, partial [Enterococcus faecalis]|nr:amidase [Enterococcus faecalis]
RYDLALKTLEERIAYNQHDKKVRGKYGEDLLERNVKKKQSDKEIIQRTTKTAQQKFDALLKKQQLDGYAFIDAEGTGLSAVAGYPELTVPLAKNSEGQTNGLTFTQNANNEQTLFEQDYSFEQSTKGRIVLTDSELLAYSKKINRDEQ